MESTSNSNLPPESYVTLKINVPECSISKTIKFNANQTVQEAIIIIKQKIGTQFLEQIVADNQNGTKSAISPKKTKSDSKEKKKSNDFGVYLGSRNIWLDELDTLAFYEIREMETVDFKLKPDAEEKERRNSLTGSLRKKIASSFRRKSDADSTQSSAKEVLSAASSASSPSRSRRNSSNYITPAMLATIPCQDGHYRVIVECPNTISQHMAEFDSSVTVQQLKEAVSTRERIEDPQNFALYIRVTTEPKETQARLCLETSTLFDYKVHELGRNLVLKRTWLPLNIRLEDGKMVKWLVSPTWTVHFVLRMLKKVHGLKNKGYGLFLVAAKSLHRRQNSSSENSELTSSQTTSPLMNYEGMLMEKKRKLASYRLGINDILEFKSESLDLKKKLEANSSEESNENTDLFLVIESPEQGISKTFHFPTSTTVAEVIETFILKNPLIPYTENDSSSSGNYKVIFGEDERNYKRYCLCQKQTEGAVTPPSPSRSQKETATLTKLDYSQPLKFYKLPHMARLIIKQNEESPRVLNPNDSKLDYFKFTSNIVDAEAGFGVPMQTLPYTTDVTGLKVPVVLALLRKCLVDKKAFEQEGIFRINGMETQSTEFRKLIASVLSKSTDRSQWEFVVSQLKDVNCATSLIKRWYLNLPTKILAGISLATLQQWKQEQVSVTELVSKFEEPAKSALHYLMDLALEVVKQQGLNKMSAKGISRLFSAILIDFAQQPPQQSLEISMLLSNVLEAAINIELITEEIQEPLENVTS